MALDHENSKLLYVQRLKKLSGIDYAIRFGGDPDKWHELKDALKEEMKSIAGNVFYDPYEFDGKGGWVVDETTLMYVCKDYFGPQFMQHVRIADARYDDAQGQRHAG